MRYLLMFACTLLVLGLLGFWGLRIKPAPLPRFEAVAPDLAYVPLPAGLPAPVTRFYQTIMGERVPLIESAIISGRGYLRLGGIKFPARARFTHEAGQGYRHYIEGTLFGRRLFQANEWYLDGRVRMELPVGVIENDRKSDEGAALGLWAETALLPSLFVTDPRVRWEAIDETHARLIVPSPAGEDAFTVTFDAETGLLVSLEALRWKSPESPAKLRWTAAVRDWVRRGEWLLPSTMAASWEDEQGPWLVLTTDEVIYNVDVTAYIRAKGL